MVELDTDVAAVWQTVLSSEDGEWLAREILAYNLTLENVEPLLNEAPATVRERAFQTIVKNRVNRGGILAPGAGLLKFGENGKGIQSRWYPRTLAKRIRRITPLRNQITFIYTYNELDHERLFDLASHIRGDFLMTYDNSEEARGLAARYGFDTRLLPMSNTHHTRMTELLIGRNLDWVRIPEPGFLPEENARTRTTHRKRRTAAP